MQITAFTFFLSTLATATVTAAAATATATASATSSEDKTLYCPIGQPLCCESTQSPTELTPEVIEALEAEYIVTAWGEMQTNVGINCE